MTIKIRKMKQTDISSIKRLIKQTLGELDAKKAKQDMDTQSKKLYAVGGNFVAVLDEEVVGVIGYWQLSHHPKKVVWLDWFAVSPDMQNKGIGSQLLNHLLLVLKKKNYQMLCCEKSSKDTKADAFYKKHFFTEFGRIEDYWEDNGDLVLIMRKL